MNQSLWWQSGIVYQIYPRSFADSNGDGIGDLPGIGARLDHLVALGVDAIWISPFFPSPMADFGYDVADYTDVDPMFGTLADFDALAAEVHARGMKIILDFVPNHSSDHHKWFVESRSSRDNPKRDWYIWRDGKGAGPPNNWRSRFGGPAWSYDEATGQWYSHTFLKQQPDLNWRNPAVRAAMYEALRFWMRRGVDGFRVDVLWVLIKDDQFRDNPPNPEAHAGQSYHDQLIPLYTADRPEMSALVQEMRRVMEEFPGRIMIGEIYLPLHRLVSYYGTALDEAHLPFNFLLIRAEWQAEALAIIIRDYLDALPEGAWPNWVLGNHDQSRIATRIGPAKARLAAMLLLTLRGTPTIYYGDEIGMTDAYIPPELVQDPAEKNEPGLGLGRDPERTPMQWDAGPAAGFTTGTPWLPVSPQYGTVNVAVETQEPDSMLSLHRALIALRRATPALTMGAQENVRTHGSVLAFDRVSDSERLTILLNFGDQSQAVPNVTGRVLLGTGEVETFAGAVLAQTGLILQV